MSEPAPLLPMSPLPVLTKKPVSVKSPLPPLTKKELPVLEKKELPVLEKKVSVKSPLPPLSKLPPLEKKKLPVLKVEDKPSLPKTVKLPPLASPLAKEVKEKRKEIIQEITEDVKEKEIKKKALPPLVKDISKAKTLPPLVSGPVFTKEKTVSDKTIVLPTLKRAQEGVGKALLSEPEAAFQPVLKKAVLPPLSGVEETSPSLATIVSPANLPTKKSKDKTPKIKIPKIKSSVVKPSPKKRQASAMGEGISLPTDSTVIPPIPVKSPSTVKVSKVKKASEPSEDMVKKVMSIDVTKLKTGRATGKDTGYSVSDLKSIAGGLGLTKSGNKKELVERIKQAILKVNPSALDV